MSSWRDRLNFQKGPSCTLTKLPKPPFVSSGSEQGGHIEKIAPLTDRQREAVAILKADPTLRRAFRGEPTPEGFRLAVALRKPDGRIVTGELVLPEPPDLPGLAEAFAAAP